MSKHKQYHPRTVDDKLDHLIEECAELIQECAKAKRFGIGNHHPDDPEKTSNGLRMRNELLDIISAADALGIVK